MNRDPDTRRAFIVSLVLHGLVLGALLASLAWHHWFAKPLPDHVFQLSTPVPDAPNVATEGSHSSTPPKIVKVAPLPEPTPPPPQPEAAKPPPPKPAATPRPAPAKPKPEPAKPRQETIDYSAFLKENKLPKQAHTTPRPAHHRPTPHVKIDASAIARDLQQNLSREDNVRVSQMSSAQQSELFDYFQQLKAIIDANFDRPDGLGQALVTRVQFEVRGNGSIASAHVVNSSGNAALDQAALDTFRKIGAFPPPPDGAGYTRTVAFTMRTE